jgi:Nickel responsive protein SCO4226-like
MQQRFIRSAGRLKFFILRKICYTTSPCSDCNFNTCEFISESKTNSMKLILNRVSLLVAGILLTGLASIAQSPSADNAKNTNTTEMKTYLIEREIPGAGKLTAEELKGVSQKSCSVLREMGPGIQWVQSYVTGNKIYCIYKAENEDLIREHAKKGGFPANKIVEISSVISPATAEQ